MHFHWFALFFIATLTNTACVLPIFKFPLYFSCIGSFGSKSPHYTDHQFLSFPHAPIRLLFRLLEQDKQEKEIKKKQRRTFI